MAVKKTVSRYPLDYSVNAGLLQAAKGFALDIDEDGYLKAIAVVPFTSNSSAAVSTNNLPATIVDPINTPGFPNPAARCYGNPSGGVVESVVGLVTNSRKMLYDSYSAQWYGMKSLTWHKQVSAVDTAQTMNVITSDFTDGVHNLEIYMVCSGGTATLDITGSVDGTLYLTLDSIAAALATAKHYDRTTVGATTALCPLGLTMLKITAGPAGAGFTTAIYVSMR